jgi:hypothetical protein
MATVHVEIRATDRTDTCTNAWADVTDLAGTTILYLTGDIQLINLDTAIDIQFRFKGGNPISVPAHSSGFADWVISLRDQVLPINLVQKLEVKADSGTPAFQILYCVDTRYANA